MDIASPLTSAIDRRRALRRLAIRLFALLACLSTLLATPAAAEPKVTAQHGGYVEHATISGDYAYVAQGSSIVTLRLGDSAQPMNVASVSAPLGGMIWAVAVYRNRLYAAPGDFHTQSAALSIFSLRDPARPSFLGHLDAPGIFPFSPEGLAVMGDVLYVLSSGDLVPIDLGDPDRPVVGMPVHAPFLRRLTPYDRDHLIAWGPTIFPFQPGALIFDVAAPMAPVRVGEILAAFHFDLDVGDGYIVSSGPSLRVFDLSDPAIPTQVAQRNGFEGEAGELVDDHYLVPDGDNVRVWYLGDPKNPVEVATVPAPVAEARWAFRGSGRALVFTDFGTAVQLDVSKPAAPALASSLDLPVGALPLALARVGSDYYVADAYRGLRLLDAKMRTLADVEPSWPSVLDIAVDGSRALLADFAFGLLYVADSGSPGGLRIFDVSGAVPVQLSRFVGCQPNDVDVFGSIAALPCATSGMQLVDVSDPASPTLLGTYEPAGNPFLLLSTRFGNDGQLVYLGLLDALDVVDVSDPTQPVQTQRLEVGGFLDDLETDSDGRIWALGGEAGLARIDELGPIFGRLDKPALRSSQR